MHPIVTLPNGTEICANLVKSEVSQSIARQPQLLRLVQEILEGKNLSGPEIRIERDMGRVVGYDFIVETKESDSIFYAKVLHEDTYTRFVKNGKPVSTQYVAIVLKRIEEGRSYELRSARIGRMTPPRPGAEDETPESKEYWTTHALIHEGEILQMRTATKVCPY